MRNNSNLKSVKGKSKTFYISFGGGKNFTSFIKRDSTVEGNKTKAKQQLC